MQHEDMGSAQGSGEQCTLLKSRFSIRIRKLCVVTTTRWDHKSQLPLFTIFYQLLPELDPSTVVFILHRRKWYFI